MEPERDAVTGQQVEDLVNPGRRLRPDHGNRRELAALLAPPLLERLGDGPVELLIRRPHGLGQVEVDLPQRCRLHDGRHGRLVAPGDQQAAPGGGMPLTHPREELRAGPARHPLVSQDQRHVGALTLKLFQPGQRLLRRRAGHDPVIRPVPAFQFPRQRLAASVLVIDNHDDRSGHDGHPRSSRPCGPRPRRPVRAGWKGWRASYDSLGCSCVHRLGRHVVQVTSVQRTAGRGFCGDGVDPGGVRDGEGEVGAERRGGAERSGRGSRESFL